MIPNLKTLRFYIQADAIMNEQVFPHGFLRRLLFPCPIEKFLRILRITEYLNYKSQRNILWMPSYLLYKQKYQKISVKCGYEIPLNSLGYGCRIGHRCGIIISGSTKIGNYCCLYRCSCADGNPKRIGNHVFIGTNVVIAKNVTIADGCFISAMSLVNKDVLIKNTVVGGYLLAS
jgi:serine O-acetyltransferase